MLARNRFRQLCADLLFPEHNACHLCDRFSDPAGILCSRCAENLKAMQYQEGRIASPELHAPLKACLSAYPHRNEARELVHLLKYRSDCAAADLLGQGMAAALAASVSPAEFDAIVPVPLHLSRLETRGYNQALLLAQAVCNHTGIRLMEDALIRVLPTDTQLHRSQAQRMQAMRHAFAANNPGAVRGLRLLLADDVLTTGATAVSCANALLAAGASSVSLLTACRA